jgi:hypothetical protein
MKRFILSLALITATVTVAVPALLFAADGEVIKLEGLKDVGQPIGDQELCPNTGGNIIPCKGLDCTFGCFVQLLVNIFNFLLGMAALVLILILIFGGVQYLTYSLLEVSASELAATPLENAKFTIRRAIFGFIVVASAWLIVNTLLGLFGVNGGIEQAVNQVLNPLAP